jgi:hypothetical protein
MASIVQLLSPANCVRLPSMRVRTGRGECHGADGIAIFGRLEIQHKQARCSSLRGVSTEGKAVTRLAKLVEDSLERRCSSGEQCGGRNQWIWREWDIDGWMTEVVSRPIEHDGLDFPLLEAGRGPRRLFPPRATM